MRRSIFEGCFCAQLIEQGRTERLETLRALVGTAMGARGLALSELGRARLEATTEIAVVSAWVARTG